MVFVFIVVGFTLSKEFLKLALELKWTKDPRNASDYNVID